MIFILSKIKNLLPEFNERSLTENDFYTICEAEGITLIEHDKPFSWWMTVENKPFIVLNKRLRGIKRLYVMWHELGHHFLHFGSEPNQVYFSEMTKSKAELEADILAILAVCPMKALQTNDFVEEYPNKFATKLFKERQKILFLYRI